jgi:hypothetical protein
MQCGPAFPVCIAWEAGSVIVGMKPRVLSKYKRNYRISCSFPIYAPTRSYSLPTTLDTGFTQMVFGISGRGAAA